MEEQKPASPPTPTPASQPIIVKKSNYLPLVIAIVFLALVIAGAAAYLGMQKPTEKEVALSPTPESISPTSQVPSATPVPTDKLANWETANVSKMKDLSFPGYSIKYPTGWVAKEAKDDISQTLTLTKGANPIKIAQIPTGGNQCVFEGDLPDGPANDYRDEKFTEVKAGTITFRRIPGATTSSLCSNSPQSQDSFGIPTVFGNISYTVSSDDVEAILEMDAIIATLTQTP